VKPVNEKAVEVAAVSSPTRPPTEGRQSSTGGATGCLSPSEETPPSALQNGHGALPKALPREPAATTQARREGPASLQEGPRPREPVVTPPDTTPPPTEAERQPFLPTDVFSLDSTETSVLGPTSFSDSDPLEAAFDGASSPGSEKLIPDQPADMSVNVHIKESLLPNADDVAQSSESAVMRGEKGESGHEVSHLAERGRDERERVVVKSPVTTLGGGIEGCDAPDGLESDELRSVSEAVPPSLEPEPKTRKSIFKRNKKKSNQGNLSVHLNKDPVWNASRLMCYKWRLVVFLLYLTGNIIYFKYLA